MSGTKTATLITRTTPKLKRFIEKAADRSGMTTADWTRAVLARAANEGALAPPRRPKPIAPEWRTT